MTKDAANEQSQAVEREAAVPGGDALAKLLARKARFDASDRNQADAYNLLVKGCDDIWKALAATPAHRPPQPEREAAVPGEEPFQARVHDWVLACFGAEIGSDRIERNHRFIEEALELVQSTGCTHSEAHQLVDYVYGRPAGEPFQEVGGVMNTLAALCTAHDLDLDDAAEAELARVWTKVEKIRAKQAAKPKHSPLPEYPAHRPPQPGVVTEELREAAGRAAHRAAQSVYRADHDHFPLSHSWETLTEQIRDGWRKIGSAALLAVPSPGASVTASPAAETAPDAGLVAELRHLERAATKVAKYGAQTGPQWTILAGALISARAALSRAGERS